MWSRFDIPDDGRKSDDWWNRGPSGRGGGERNGNGDPHDVFTKDIDLPRGQVREQVRVRERVHELDGADSRALATIGAFRVVAESDLHSVRDDSQGSGRSLKRLETEGLIRTTPLNSNDRAVTLTDRGRNVLEADRYQRDERTSGPCQTFYAGVRKPRELTHDAHVYRAYQRVEERLRARGGHVRRVVLDYELKREYQQFLQERNRGRADSTGRPDREQHEIAAWAREHDLPFFEGSVHFPDARIEYEDQVRHIRHEDIEIVTEHYRGSHAAAASRSGFSRYRIGLTVRTSGARGGGGRSSRSRWSEELLG
jgi:DNA-binding PadR family transcriptional regulator